jgi:hypothetical protein
VKTSFIQILKNNLRIALTFQRTRFTLGLFLMLGPTEFWEMVGIGEPLALEILAKYAVILRFQGKHIWMEG